ncbi:hypothetical protein SAMCCGM7_pC0440 (plasmid) [Sinorhizobium americanum CCGM7]|uniref:hypothetical protein n=1 Tax=Sinorhizobium americanum TaxID=194963 RepID=UPI0004D6E1D6|nr:hypothetical protein [Sinorhizobium americanum]APG87642.1 hypothetical protein SAMCCGM7_pC0440 [Sinorhizobium americanum CCGM7]
MGSKDGYPDFDAHTVGGKFQLDHPSHNSSVSKDAETLFREYPDAFQLVSRRIRRFIISKTVQSAL